MVPMPSPGMLDCASRKQLLTLAREVILSQFEERNPHIPPSIYQLNQPRSVFVTLIKQGRLRGCIGSLTPEPLWRAVMHQAIQAAFHDPRFPALTREEFEQSMLEISILSPLHKQEGDWYARLLPGRHGLLLDWGFTRAVFLPSVWKELPYRDVFVSALSRKAGLTDSAWTHAQAFFFTVEEFSEDSPCPEETL